MPRARLDPDVSAVSGRQGDTVYFMRGGVAYQRSYAEPSDPKTAGQRAARARLKQAAQLWLTLTPAQVELWEAWAQAHPTTDFITRKTYALSAYSAFQSLTLKWLAVHQTGTPPPAPPADRWAVPEVVVTASAAAEGITWAALNSVPDNAVCELLSRPVKTRRVPTGLDRFRAILYTDFTGDGSQTLTPLPPGLHAPAYRWVRLSSGERGPIVRLPVVLST